LCGALLTITLLACGRPKDAEEAERSSSSKASKTAAKSTPSSDPIPAPSNEEPTGPRYLRPDSQGTLVDAFQFPSVPAFMVEQQVAAATTKSDAAGILRRFGLSTLEGRAGHVWIAKASLVDRLARERILVVSFVGEASGEGVRDEDAWLVFLGSTSDDRVLKIGNARIKARATEAGAIEVDARELHSNKSDDVIATWSSCTKPLQKACNGLRAWTMQRGYPELIADVTGDSKPVISGGVFPPHDIVVDGRTLKFDNQAFAYK